MEEKLAKLEQAIEEYKKVTAKECYGLKFVEGEPAITDNKFGGQPYLPVGEEYPTDKDGKPLALLLQVNLKDIDLPGWPKEGVLEIFTDAEVGYPCQYAVKCFPADQEYQETFPEVDTSHYIVPSGHKIELEKAVAFMSPNDFRFNETAAKVFGQVSGQELKNVGAIFDCIEGDYKWQEKIYDETSKTPSAMIGGYQDFTQSDPRGYNEAMASKTESLFKFDSVCEGGAYMIGDSGILFSFISPEDLRDGKFENAVVDWDCC